MKYNSRYQNRNVERPKISKRDLGKIAVLGGLLLAIIGGVTCESYKLHQRTEEYRRQRFEKYDSLTHDGAIDLDEYIQGNKYSLKSIAELTREFIAMDKNPTDGRVTLEEFR